MRTKTKKIGWLVLAVVAIFVLIAPNIAADDPEYGVFHEYGNLPDGVTVSSQPYEERDIEDYPEINAFDGFQLRQSICWVSSFWEPRGPYGRASLVGWSEDFILYFPIGETHDLLLTGYLKMEYADGTVDVRDNFWHSMTWTNNGQVPWLLWVQISIVSSKELKRIEYDVNYFEDGQYVRHIHRVFIDPTYYNHELISVSTGQNGCDRNVVYL